MKAMAAAALLVAVAVAGCLSTDSGEDTAGPASPGGGAVAWDYEVPEPEPQDPMFDGVRFIAVGDVGTGKTEQYQVARAMEDVCAASGCDFVLGLGDNIYESGVFSAYDEQFETKFEQPYSNLSIPWYLTLGNHDNSGDPCTSNGGPCDTGFGHWYESGNYMVDYHYRQDRSSDKWNMPARYYDMAWRDLSLFSLDTNTLMFYGIAAPPTDFTYGQQEAWIDGAVASTNTSWKVAFAHHPYISNGQHGNAGSYECGNPELSPVSDLCVVDMDYPHPFAGTYVKAFYEQHVCGKVDVIITGHDHDLQWLAPVESCGGTEFIVSGAGSKTRALVDPERNEAYFQQGDTLGFFWIELDGDELTGQVYDATGAMLFERTLVKS